MERINANGLVGSEINEKITEAQRRGETELVVENAHAKHNIAAGLTGTGTITVTDNTGLYTASFLDGPRVVVEKSVGWYAGDDMLSGELIIQKNTGCNVGAYICGGTIVIYGNSGSRCGYGMKGGTILVCGNAGRWSAYMATGGSLVVLGTLGQQTGESMYFGTVFTRDPDAANKLGGNVFLDDATEKEQKQLAELFVKYGVSVNPEEFKVIRPVGTGRHKYVLFSPKLDPEKKFYQKKEARQG